MEDSECRYHSYTAKEKERIHTSVFAASRQIIVAGNGASSSAMCEVKGSKFEQGLQKTLGRFKITEKRTVVR